MPRQVNHLGNVIRLPFIFEQPESALAKVARKVGAAFGSALKDLGYAAFIAGVVSVALLGVAIASSAPVALALYSIPSYLTLGGGAAYTLGALFQGLSQKHVAVL